MSFFSRIRKVLHDLCRFKDGGQECPPYQHTLQRLFHAAIKGPLARGLRGGLALGIDDRRRFFDLTFYTRGILEHKCRGNMFAAAQALENADQVGISEAETLIAAAGQTPDHVIKVGAKLRLDAVGGQYGWFGRRR